MYPLSTGALVIIRCQRLSFHVPFVPAAYWQIHSLQARNYLYYVPHSTLLLNPEYRSLCSLRWTEIEQSNISKWKSRHLITLNHWTNSYVDTLWAHATRIQMVTDKKASQDREVLSQNKILTVSLTTAREQRAVSAPSWARWTSSSLPPPTTYEASMWACHGAYVAGPLHAICYDIPPAQFKPQLNCTHGISVLHWEDKHLLALLFSWKKSIKTWLINMFQCKYTNSINLLYLQVLGNHWGKTSPLYFCPVTFSCNRCFLLSEWIRNQFNVYT